MKKLIFQLSIGFLVSLIFSFIVVVLFYSEKALDINLDLSLMSPSWSHWFGTDSLGRDLFARVMLGAKTTFIVGTISAVLALFIGLLIGTVISMVGGFWEQLFMRIIEVIDSVPSILWICLFYFSVNQKWPTTPGYLHMILAITMVAWISSAKLARVASHKVLVTDFILAAKALGASPTRILRRHVLPNMLGSMVSIFSYSLTYFFIFDSVVSFYGFGIQPPEISWGVLILEGWKSLAYYPHILLCPSLLLFVTIFSLNGIIQYLKSEMNLTL